MIGRKSKIKIVKKAKWCHLKVFGKNLHTIIHNF
jgi:hypothetical protein